MKQLIRPAMDDIHSIFAKKKVVLRRLEPFGFRRTDTGYAYEKTLPASGFTLTVIISADGEVQTTVVDPALNEPYTLHLTNGAGGSFIGAVRAEYEQVLTDIADLCFVPEVFQSAQAQALIGYVRDTYNDELEFLWEKFPDNAVWRRKDTAKWYAALLTVSQRKLGLDADETAEIIDLRLGSEQMDALIDNKRYFPGWHMNKKNWYTVILDGSVSIDELRQRIDESYRLAIK